MHSKTLAGIEPTNTPYVISTPGGRVITKQLVMYTPLNLAGKLFRTSLIVLDGQGIKVPVTLVHIPSLRCMDRYPINRSYL
jgi:hypothetical protein